MIHYNMTVSVIFCAFREIKDMEDNHYGYEHV